MRLIDRLNIGGPTKHVVWLTGGLDADAFETVLITGTASPSEGDMRYFAQAAGIEPLRIGEMRRELNWGDLIALVKLLRWLWRLKPDIVHTHKSKAGALGRVAAVLYRWMTPSALWFRPRRCHIVHTYHGHIFHSYYPPGKTRLFLAIEQLLSRTCTDRIVVLSEQQRREIAEHFRVGRPSQFRVIPLGIDLDEITTPPGHLRKTLDLPDDALLVGAVGRLCTVKNHAMLLEAMARVVAKSCGSSAQLYLVLIGDGDLRQDLQALSRRLGLADRVVFTGFRDDVMALYGDLDVVALTSLNEGTSLTLIEAMWHGRAVVATEVGGIADLMGAWHASSDGLSIWDHGVTTASRDGEAFARALQFLIERPELRRDMGSRGRAFVRTQLSKDRLVRDIEELYRELLDVPPQIRSCERRF